MFRGLIGGRTCTNTRSRTRFEKHSFGTPFKGYAGRPRHRKISSTRERRNSIERTSSSPSRTDLTTARLMSHPFPVPKQVDLRLFIGKINPFSLLFFLFIEELGSRSVLFARRRERKSNSNRGGRVMTPRDSHLSPISNHYFSNWSLTLSLSCASLRRL